MASATTVVTRRFLFALLVVTAAARRVAHVHALSRDSIRTHLPDTTSLRTITAKATATVSATKTTTATTTMTNENPGSSGIRNNHNIDGARDKSLLNRKQALGSISSALLSGFFVATTTQVFSPEPAGAFDRSFPEELTDSDKTTQLGVLVGQRSNSQQRKQKAELQKRQLDQNLQSFSVRQDALPSLTWALALFFLTGSRSTPIATPLANLIYDETDENPKWLQDRNAGLFSDLPLLFLGLLGVVFLVLGTILQFTLLQLSEGDSVVCGQLAGVALINGGFFEIGRIASGEKGLTRDEDDRATMLSNEFEAFAEKRLQPGGNCHRSDVVKSFRRFNPKYRQVDSEQYPLTDREVEQLLKDWNRQKNFGRAEMSSSGFYYGIQINSNADVFY